MTCDGVVLLPPGRPGRIEVADEVENGITEKNEGTGDKNSTPWLNRNKEKGPSIWDESAMRSIALDEARQVLPREMQTMFSPEVFMDVFEMCKIGPDAPDEEISEKLAECLVDLVWTPLAGCVPTLRGIDSSDVRFKLQLFWRCAVALCAMPTKQLIALSERKRRFLQDLDSHLPAKDSNPAAARLAHIRLNLPLFSMTAKFPSESEKAPPSQVVPEDTVKADQVAVQELGRSEATKSEIQVAGDEHGGDVRAAVQTVNQAFEVGPQADNKALTAAKHTYDVGYRKWEKFDVDSALHEVDKVDQPRKEAVKIPLHHDEMGTRRVHEDPMKALDEAIERMNDKTASQPNNAAKSAAENTGGDTSVGPCDTTDLPAAEPCQTQDIAVPPEVHIGSEPVGVQEALQLCPGDRVEIFGLESELGRSLNGNTGLVEGHDEKSGRVKVRVASAAASSRIMLLKAERLRCVSTSNVEAEDANASAGSTAAALNKDYKKWEHFEEEDIDDVDSDDGFTDRTLHDLDALTGPKEEIAKIHAHWRREGKRQKRSAHKHPERTQGFVGERDPAHAAIPPEETGPVIHRPCVYRPPNAPEVAPAKALDREYNKWKEFDADAALLGFENEGTTQEGTAMRCSAGGGSACINTEGYTKDREEYELDQDIETHMGGLKKIIAQRLQDAAGLKAEGNSYMREKRLKDAVIAYKGGLAKMEICQQASVIMADSMSSKQTRLVGDLHRNLAAAQLELGDFEGARENCDRALECTSANGEGPDEEKARYRRATALLQLGRVTEAQPDIKRLAACRGADDPVVKRLMAQAADQTN